MGFSLSVIILRLQSKNILQTNSSGAAAKRTPPPTAVRLRGRRLLGGTWPRSAPVGLQPRRAAKAPLAQKKGQRGLWRGHLAG